MDFALSFLLRGSPVLLAAAAFCAFRRLSAADRHALLLSALVAQLAILASVLVPMPRHDVSVRALPAGVAELSSVRSLRLPVVPIMPESATRAAAEPDPDPLSLFLLLCWLSGSGILLARLAWSHGWARRVVRGAVPADGTTVSGSGQYHVRLSERAEVAFAYGWLRPVIVLPAVAASWSAERQRMVLVHEAEHLRRRDGLWNSVIEVTRALCWPNPLVWWVARRARLEAERAADDAVVREGHDATRYIHELVGLVRASRSPAAALAIHRPGQFESRAASLLDSGGPRTPYRPARAAPFLSAGTLLTVAAVTLGLTGGNSGPWAEIADGGRTLRLLPGATVHFEGTGELRFRDGRQTIDLAPTLRIIDAPDGEVEDATLELTATAGSGSGWLLRRIDRLPSGPGSRIHDSDGTGTASVRSASRISFYVQVTQDGETLFFHPEPPGS